MMDAVRKALEDSHDRYLRELAEFVAIPSVSTDPERAEDVRRAAAWVEARLARAGRGAIDVEVWRTPRHPAVFGRYDGARGAPRCWCTVTWTCSRPTPSTPGCRPRSR
ncbi:MAG: hypothetical protein P8Z81_05665 [Deinococcales bacterium]